jgi:hypothetical protein
MRHSASVCSVPPSPREKTKVAVHPRVHPLVDYPILSPYNLLQDLYNRHGKVFDGIRLDIDQRLSSRDLSRGIQFCVMSKRPIVKGELITPYGGVAVHNKEYRKLGGVAAGCPLTHARSIPNTDCVLDGLPFAQMMQRPIPGDAVGLQRIIDAGIETLMPTVEDGFTPEQISAFHRSPIGYMINTASVRKVNCHVKTVSIADGTSDIPFIYASRSIPANAELFCSYHNTEQHLLAGRNPSLVMYGGPSPMAVDTRHELRLAPTSKWVVTKSTVSREAFGDRMDVALEMHRVGDPSSTAVPFTGQFAADLYASHPVLPHVVPSSVVVCGADVSAGVDLVSLDVEPIAAAAAGGADVAALQQQVTLLEAHNLGLRKERDDLIMRLARAHHDFADMQ